MLKEEEQKSNLMYKEMDLIVMDYNYDGIRNMLNTAEEYQKRGTINVS